MSVDAESKRAEHDAGKDDLRHGIEFGDPQRLHQDGTAEHPGQHHRADDHNVARHHENDQPAGNDFLDAQGHVDRDDERLVSERVEIRAERARHVEALGEEAVDGVTDARRQEQHERNPHGARIDRPDDDRHQQNTPQLNEVRNTHGSAPRLAYGSDEYNGRLAIARLAIFTYDPRERGRRWRTVSAG